MKINTIKLLSLRNDEHFQFNSEHIALINECGANALNIAALFDDYYAHFQEEDAALKKVEKSDYTRLIKDADHIRDGIYSGIVLVNHGNSKHYEPNVKAAATRVKILFDTYGNLSKKPINEQTAAITNIIQDLRGKYAEDVDATGIGGWVDELERTNNIVAKLVKERADETASKVTIVLKEARADVDTAYRAIVERVGAAVIIEGQEKYETYINKLNEIIHRYMQAIKVREGRAKKKHGGDE